MLSKAQSAIDDIGALTLEQSGRVVHARRLCDGLGQELLELLPNYPILVHAEEQLLRLEAEAAEPVPEEASALPLMPPAPEAVQPEASLPDTAE